MPTKDDYFEASKSGGSHEAAFKTLTGDGVTPPFALGASMSGGFVGVLAFAGLDTPTVSFSERAGVTARSFGHPGVVGTSQHFPGVYGQTEDGPLVPFGLAAGVLGAAVTQPGVIGYSRLADGVEGLSFTGTAVSATAFDRPAVFALSGALSGVTGISGMQGPALPDRPTTGGVVGTSDTAPGVIGTSNSIGAYAFSGNVGILAQTTNPVSFAGYFAGNVNVTETLTANVKNAVVAFPDGTRRLLHCMESPEHWFEDFGAARLKNGRAVVEIDADFAKVIKRGDYHVFLTPLADCGGLRVWRQGGTSFAVREIGEGKSDVEFSYRIVGRRRDTKAHRRFAKADTDLPMPVAKSRPPRKPTASAFRSFVAKIDKQARERARKRKRTDRRARALAKHFSPLEQLDHARRER